MRRGDTLVLCSDGLSGQVTKDDIARRSSREETDLTTACKRLIDRANENGGPDNITVIVARFDGPGLHASRATKTKSDISVFPLRDSGASGPMDRVMTGTTPTQPMPVVERPGMVRPTPDPRD